MEHWIPTQWQSQWPFADIMTVCQRALMSRRSAHCPLCFFHFALLSDSSITSNSNRKQQRLMSCHRSSCSPQAHLISALDCMTERRDTLNVLQWCQVWTSSNSRCNQRTVCYAVTNQNQPAACSRVDVFRVSPFCWNLFGEFVAGLMTGESCPYFCRMRQICVCSRFK